MNTNIFCPNCGIGLNHSELRLCFCQNCKFHWEVEDEPDCDDEKEFQPCEECDGHPACEDFGCAVERGLRHLLQPQI